MRLERLELKDFMRWHQADIDFGAVRLASVIGPNGAGKSGGFLLAPVFALTGGRGLRSTMDLFIRRGAEECRVGLTFTTGGERYRVTRTRSSRGNGKSTVELARQDGGGLWVAEGTGARDTEERIRGILGLDEETLLLTAFVAQSDSGAFFKLQPARRLEAFGSILRIDERFGPLEKHFKILADAAKADLEAARRDVERLEDEVGRLAEKEEALLFAAGERNTHAKRAERSERGLAEANAALEAARKGAADSERAEAELTRLTDHRAQLEAREHELAQERDRLAVRVSHRAELEQQLADRYEVEEWLGDSLRAREADQATEAERRRLTGMVTAAEAALKQARTDYRTAEQMSRAAERTHSDALESLRLVTQERADAQERIATIEQAEQPVCDRCGQEIADAARERTLAGLRKELENVEDRARLARDRVESTAAAVEECAGRTEGLKDRGHEASALLDNRREELLDLPAPAHDRLDHEHYEARLRELDEIPARLAEIAVLEERLAAVEIDVENARAAREAPALADALTNAREAVSAAQSATGALRAAEHAVQGAEATLKSAREAHAEADRAVARIEGEIAQLAPSREALTDMAAAAKCLEQEQADAELLRKAFSKWGVPALIVGNVLLALEKEVNGLLSLYEGGMAVRFDAARETRDGARDSLEIMVYDGTDWAPFETLSGGEGYRVASAMRLGLALLLAHRSGARIDTLILDEPEGLDSVGREHLARILQRMSETYGLVLCLSHYPDLVEAFPQQIVVSRGEDGLSRVEVAA